MRKEGYIAAGWVVLAFCIGIFLVARESGSNVHSIYYGRLPDFQLTDSQGKDFEYKDISGQIWVIQFSKSATIDFPDLPLEVGTLTILTNSYQSSINDSKSKIVYSDLDKITHLATDGFHFTKELLNGEYTIPLVLIDKLGNIRGYYNPEREKDIKKLGRDIDSLLQFS
ncbi:MAG: hypothetical protein H8E70_05375 [Candidatus Marinimicrobia bacterium]|nr:hypothetical protein [Candidatus Neomarinimicrobiota bacterium]